MSESVKMMSALDIFAKSQETFDEAKKKSEAESGNRINYFRISKEGKYTIRILPLAPVIDADGNVLPMERKGYEYPVKELVLKITGGKKPVYVNVCNAKSTFPAVESDLIDKYVELALSMYADDKQLCDKLQETSFNGGLKWNSKRSMYILDMDKRNDGIQVFQLSYAQYKELEERKLEIWKKLSKSGNVPCPISSIQDAYPVEITRKKEGSKVSYSFNIDTLSPKDALTEGELQSLLDAPRLPEVLYRYSRYHLEATIAFLNQFDEATGMEVMKEEEIKNCIEQIKLCLPADDQSHFSMNDKSADESSESGENGIESLWNLYDKLCDEDLDDKSEEGQNLRTLIKEFIENNDLDVSITRKKSNETLLHEIEDALDEGEGDSDEAEDEDDAANEAGESEAEASSDTSEEESEDEDKEDEEESSRTRERNDDTNEPAVRANRREARQHKRR